MTASVPSGCPWHRDQASDERAHLVIQTVACVRCGAHVGATCRTRLRQPTERLHVIRWGMAQALTCTCPLHPSIDLESP